MKAEHRKELQTNALADRMGRMIQRVKGRPRRNTVMTWVLVIVLGLAVLFWIITSRGRKNQTARLWTQFESGHFAELADLQKSFGVKEAGKAARFQLAWFDLWEVGIKFIPRSAIVGVEHIQKAQRAYRELAEEVKDDPVLAPEALYNIAVAEESLAFLDPETHLNAAMNAYRQVAKRYPNSAHAKEAKQRAEELDASTNAEARRRIQDFYVAMGQRPEIAPLIPLMRRKE